MVKILLIRDGEVESAQTIPLHIIKSGLASDVNNFAHNEPFWYAIACLMIAISLSLFKDRLFR